MTNHGLANLDYKELKGELAGLKRIRVGDTRIVFEQINDEFIILLIATRGGVYK